jgi:hypothetical protein
MSMNQIELWVNYTSIGIWDSSIKTGLTLSQRRIRLSRRIQGYMRKHGKKPEGKNLVRQSL